MKVRHDRRNSPAGYIVCGVIFLLAAFMAVIVWWVTKTYGVGLNELLYTMFTPLKGTGTGVVKLVIRSCLPPIVFAAALYVACAVIVGKIKQEKRVSGRLFGRSFSFSLRSFLKKAGAVLCVLSLVVSLVFANARLDYVGYIKSKLSSTDIYEREYVDPSSVSVTCGGQPRNLILLYLESMETTYCSTENGGVQQYDYMGELTALSQSNISFSNNSGNGGFISPPGCGWTMAALLASTSGTPYAFRMGGKQGEAGSSFAKDLTSLGDILAERGYEQEFLCGSDADFAGRRNYFEQHGGYKIYDYYTAIQNGDIPSDYYEWWGFEDVKLYDIAKSEILKLAAGEKPFNFTFLTADAHHTGGYTCSECGTQYSDPLANIIACSSRQAAQFVEWCSRQDFYENTTIVVLGDHPRMDNLLVGGINYGDRLVYNCFINSAVEPSGAVTGRGAAAVDMFPTILASLGYSIEGEQLGLGVNLFSGKQTLAEKMGMQAFCAELSKRSKYYDEKFND